MGHSNLVNLIYRMIPFHTGKDWLLRHHIENCPACRKQLVSLEEARLLLVQADEVGDLGGLWPYVRTRIVEKAKDGEKSPLSKPAVAKIWRLATAVTILLVALAVNFWLFRKPGPGTSGLDEPSPAGTEQVQIHYVKIDNEPAQTFIYQPRDSHIIIVWAGRNL